MEMTLNIVTHVKPLHNIIIDYLDDWVCDHEIKIQYSNKHNYAGNFKHLLEFSPNGKMIAVATIDYIVQIFTIDGKHIKVLDGHSYLITKISWSHGGTFMASLDDFNVLKIWNVGTEEC